MSGNENQVGKIAKEETRKIVPIVYSIILWIIGVGFLVGNLQNNHVLWTITIIYMISATPFIFYFILEQQKMEHKFGEVKE